MNDADAVRQCVAGQTQAFEHLVRRYQARALTHARNLTGNGADAADATQDAFVDAFKNLVRFDVTREFYPWFYVLLRNRCTRQRTRVATRLESAPIGNPRDGRRASAPDTLDLRTALDQLEPQDRELIVLKHLDGWTYDELASRLMIPRGTVMSRLFNARRKLQRLMFGETP
ncbi:MAG: sigma-70 family RNA polymerase sigma factor [Chloroflexota bacterium]|nr:sigma-70 family RNA polymerase sigma factor [Chloroflexota bacterium]